MHNATGTTRVSRASRATVGEKAAKQLLGRRSNCGLLRASSSQASCVWATAMPSTPLKKKKEKLNFLARVKKKKTGKKEVRERKNTERK